MKRPRRSRAFSLVEILTVIGIFAVLMAILLPVLVSVRRTAVESTCFSNERSLGQAMILYIGDNDDHFPGTATTSPGGDWGNLIRASIGGKDAFRCPADPTSLPGEWPDGGIPQTVVSYGFDSNLSSVDLSWLPLGPGKGIHRETPAHASLASPSRTVMFFEVQEAVVDLKNVEKRRSDGTLLSDYWPTGNTATGITPLGNDAQDYPNGVGVHGLVDPPLYALGSIGGRTLNGGKAARPRHGGRAIYLACDGHAKALRPESVSGGADAADASCDQGTVRGQAGPCAAQRAVSAAGTGNDRYSLTFSAR